MRTTSIGTKKSDIMNVVAEVATNHQTTVSLLCIHSII